MQHFEFLVFAAISTAVVGASSYDSYGSYSSYSWSPTAAPTPAGSYSWSPTAAPTEPSTPAPATPAPATPAPATPAPPTAAPTFSPTSWPTFAPTPEPTNPPKPVFKADAPAFNVDALNALQAAAQANPATDAPTAAPTNSPTYAGYVRVNKVQEFKVVKTGVKLQMSEAEANSDTFIGAFEKGVADSMGVAKGMVQVNTVNGKPVASLGRRRTGTSVLLVRRLQDGVDVGFSIQSASSSDSAVADLAANLEEAVTEGSVVANVQKQAAEKGVLSDALAAMERKLPKPEVEQATVEKIVVVQVRENTASPTPAPTTENSPTQAPTETPTRVTKKPTQAPTTSPTRNQASLPSVRLLFGTVQSSITWKGYAGSSIPISSIRKTLAAQFQVLEAEILNVNLDVIKKTRRARKLRTATATNDVTVNYEIAVYSKEEEIAKKASIETFNADTSAQTAFTTLLVANAAANGVALDPSITVATITTGNVVAKHNTDSSLSDGAIAGIVLTFLLVVAIVVSAISTRKQVEAASRSRKRRVVACVDSQAQARWVRACP